jgi:hypothetical protein
MNKVGPASNPSSLIDTQIDCGQGNFCLQSVLYQSSQITGTKIGDFPTRRDTCTLNDLYSPTTGVIDPKVFQRLYFFQSVSSNEVAQVVIDLCTQPCQTSSVCAKNNHYSDIVFI